MEESCKNIQGCSVQILSSPVFGYRVRDLRVSGTQLSGLAFSVVVVVVFFHS